MSSNICLGIITASGNISDLLMYATVFKGSGSLTDGKEIRINGNKEITNLGIVVQFSKLFLVRVCESSCTKIIWGPLSKALLSFPLLPAMCKEGREKVCYESIHNTQPITTSEKFGKHWIDCNTFLILIL